MQDNAPAHRVGMTMHVLENFGFYCIDYPSYTPDRTERYFFSRSERKLNLEVNMSISKVP